MNGLERPSGDIRVKCTESAGDDVLLATLGGKVEAGVAAVRNKGKYYVVAPASLGGTMELDAESLTDALHQGVDVIEHKMKGRKPPKGGCGGRKGR